MNRDDRLNEIFEGSTPQTAEEQAWAQVRQDLQSLKNSVPEPQIGFARIEAALKAKPAQRSYRWLYGALPTLAACALGLWVTMNSNDPTTPAPGPVVVARTSPAPVAIEPAAPAIQDKAAVAEPAPLASVVRKPEPRRTPKRIRRTPAKTQSVVDSAPQEVRAGAAEATGGTASTLTASAPGPAVAPEGTAMMDAAMMTTNRVVPATVVIISTDMTAAGTQAATERTESNDVLVGG
jgi:hypothetical protein